MKTDEDYTENEVLTGAELYLYLLRQNEEQQERAQKKLREYGTLRDTLQALTERSRRRVLAPVAGGLAYFPAELNATNTILVLLGDSWFAERSAVQATEIAGRRIDFLRREAEVLQQEESALRSKQDFFLSEMPEAQDAVAQLLAQKDSCRAALVKELVSSQSALAPTTAVVAGPSSEASFPTVENNMNLLQQASTVTTARSTVVDSGDNNVPPASAGPKSLSNGSSSPEAAASVATTGPATDCSELDYAAIDATLATFDEQDELTEDELIALEKELANHLDDDAYVEKVMMERMIEKKERRVRTELERRHAMTHLGSMAKVENGSQPVATTTAVTNVATPQTSNSVFPSSVQLSHATLPDAKQVVSSTSLGVGGAAGASERTTYRTPADIFNSINAVDKTTAAAAANPPQIKHADRAGSSMSDLSTSPLTARPAFPAEAGVVTHAVDSAAVSLTTSMCSYSSHKERHVHFHDEAVSESKEICALAKQPEVSSALSSAVVTAKTGEGIAGSFDASPPSLLRSTYRVGDVVEHVDTRQQTGAQPLPPLLPTQRQKPKRKSLFMRDLEGDSE